MKSSHPRQLVISMLTAYFFAHSLKCMVRRPTAREKRSADRQVCANVFVNKGEGVVKGRDFLTAAMSNARDQGV